MAKIILDRIGHSIDSFMDKDIYDNNKKSMNSINLPIIDKKQGLKMGWGEKYIKRVHDKKKLTAWERIELLKDEGTEIFPIGSFVNYGIVFGEDDAKKESPGAGVITAFIRIQNIHTIVIANDNTVASGSWWPKTPEKIQRAQEIALRLKIPVVYLIDSSGLFLPEQSRSFPGKKGAGHIFKMNSVLSARQIPQIAGVFGDCIAGGGYMPIISDIVYMTEQAYMVIAGAALIKGAKSQKITSLSIGGADIHVHLSNCADFRVPDDLTLLMKIRSEFLKIPSSAVSYYRYGKNNSDPVYSTDEIEGIISPDHRINYKIMEVIARLVDDSLFKEIYPDIGKEIVCGIGRISGLYVGLISNNQELSEVEDGHGELRPGGILYREGISKITSFIRACEDDGIPIVWLQDISGFDIGVTAEKNGLLGYGSNLLYSLSNITVPSFTILLRKASGAGYYAMDGAPFDPVLQISTPITRLAVMEGKTLAIGAYNTKLDDDFNIISKDESEKINIRNGMDNIEQRIANDMNPIKAASQMDTDEVILLSELRRYLEVFIEASYQSTGYRRIKNPRIWSIHDLIVLDNKKLYKTKETEIKGSSNKRSINKKHIKLKENELYVKAFTAGIFYRKPSPEKPPFIKVGDIVKNGTVLGMIEVMKSFNYLTFSNDNIFNRGIIKKIFQKDDSEVSSGDLLFLVEQYISD